ncbi:MAG: acetyltransferase [Pseudomonadales bacterium]|jgi:hypothetical protein
MLLKQKSTGDLLEVTDLQNLFNLNHPAVIGRYQCGEEQQDPEPFQKSDLVFLSGEALPRCWTDPHYRDKET